MSGKAYTMKEMKAIVDYLKEHKAYNDLKGRKMWVDFEKSKVLERTWQSLKETFNKRILPDIHNPYYKLSVMEISSFRNGYDVEARINNKLEIRTVSEESNANIEQAINTEHPGTSNGNASGKKSGEDTINTKTISEHRSSAETVVIDTCYDTAEDIQKDLEGKDNNMKNNTDESPQKSLRDFITYSEPLTPMLQEVIGDFATDEESDSGPRMEIVEDINMEKKTEDVNIQTNEGPIEISSDTEDVGNEIDLPDKSKENETHQDNEAANENNEQINETGQETKNATETSVQEILSTEDVVIVQDSSDFASEQVIFDTDIITDIATSNDKEENIGSEPTNNKSETTNNFEVIAATQNTSINTTDSIIPNNQEALNTQSEMVSQTKEKQDQSKTNEKENEILDNPTENNTKIPPKSTETAKESKSKSNESNKRKRATSQDPITKDKRHLIKKSKPVSVSDTDAIIKQNDKQKVNSKLLTVTSTKPKAKKLKTSDIENKEKQNTDNTKELEIVTEIDEEIPATIENITEMVDTRITSSEIENPCLKSVSLYEEQFTTTKYSESSDAAVPEPVENRQENKQTNKKSSDNDIIQLKSHSESDSECVVKRKTPISRTVPSKSEREKVLANMFGFSSGAMSHSRKRRISYRKAHRHSRTRLMSSGSSEWTSESEDEYVYPPRGRKDRHSRLYLKPKSARIFSMEEDGRLFVMYGKKIYPLVKDGKLIKNYVNYAPERGSGDEDESYWKLKYMEEKKRTAQLAKLLHQSEDNQPSIEKCLEIDLTKPSPPKKQKMSLPETETKPECSAIPENEPSKSSPVVQNDPEPVQNKTVKIKITKQNEELELEGHWSQLHPVLDHVVQIFHKEVEPKSDTKSIAPSEQSKVCLSGLSTPIIPHIDQVHEKVISMETEIFKEIEARDKEIERSVTPQSISTDTSKVTQRRPQPKRSKRSIASVSTTSEIDKNELNSSNKLEKGRNDDKMGSVDVENGTSPTSVARRITRTSKNALRESTDKSESKINTRTKKSKEPVDVEEDDVRYKLPSPTSVKKYTRSAKKTTKITKSKNRYVKKTTAVISPLDTALLTIVESSQGYQDSDISPPKLLKKRKLRRNTIAGKVRQLSRQNMRRRSQLNYYEMSDQSSNSCPDFGLLSKTIQKEGFSSNSDIYRTESLQLLMPKAKTTIGINPKNQVFTAFSEQLDRIINNGSVNNEPSVDIDLPTVANISNGNSSSNVSLPPSPVLSIVENLSIDKNSMKGFFNDNDIHENEIECNNNQLITNEDVTMLMMRQECDSEATINNADQNNANDSNAMVTDSILSKLGTVNLNQDNPTISDSLHQKIRNLILESTKKLPIPQIIEPRQSNEMDVETEVEVYKNNRSNKRCSTPLKRQANKKVKKRNTGMEAFIEEEHTDSCSNVRRSCPPLTYDPSNEYLHPESADTAKKPRKSRGRKKKDNIIKVKILRPKARSHSREILTEHSRNRETKSKHGDSGINDTESSIIHQQLNKSVELIHNHSETCLQTDECLDNSVEYVESHRSLVCLTDSDLSNNIELGNQSGTDSAKQCDLLIGDNGSNVSYNVIQTSPEIGNSETFLPVLSRGSPDSLMTEDLSEPDEEQISIRASKWYLLSEDENTNTNFPQSLVFGSDLGKLFPVACTVPNLSTITEMSKENDNKPVDPDGDTRNDLLSRSLFDSNF